MKSLAELQAIKERMQNNVMLRSNDGEETIRVVVGMATCGIAAGARPVLNAFLKEIEDRRLSNVVCTQTGCIGICRYEPVVEITTPDGVKTTYVKMDEDKVAKVVTEHIVNNKIVREFTIAAYED
ncbi:MAG: (2Fe-2S) ferredoxin domain-containing protein [Clostridia bacterium]|nr:(2Fe-2S) ferredoxin domain-containing protein [Clostridia bacterium]MBR4087298.1 (2Fe-2S) ferredoxin domain-containing protein [Clostridia bacterium]